MAIATATRALRGLRCRACGWLYPLGERYDEGGAERRTSPMVEGRRDSGVGPYVCAECFGPIEPEYDLEAYDPDETRARIAAGPASLWRYAPLLPVAEPAGHFPVGWTPLLEAPRLGAAIGVERLFLKDDSRNPSLSFKDRPVAVALARARELGLTTLACASTGNLAGAVAAAAARNGMRAFVFVPADTEAAKVAGAAAHGAVVVRVRGTYDQVNRLCARLADDLGWGFVNFTLRPYYAEGSKTLLFEVAEQLGWRLPDHVVVPVGSGALLTRTATAVRQLLAARLVGETPCRISAAQPAGCAPVSDAVLEGFRPVRPVRAPQTIARSLAIGSPADGDGSVAVVKASGGSAASVDDGAVADAIALVARTEGLLLEPAGGVVVAAAQALARREVFGAAETVVLYLTGNGYKGEIPEATFGPAVAPDADAFLAAYGEHV